MKKMMVISMIVFMGNSAFANVACERNLITGKANSIQVNGSCYDPVEEASNYLKSKEHYRNVFKKIKSEHPEFQNMSDTELATMLIHN